MTAVIISQILTTFLYFLCSLVIIYNIYQNLKDILIPYKQAKNLIYKGLFMIKLSITTKVTKIDKTAPKIR